MKILNLYAGIGGNRKLWGNEYDITAIEYDENIAKIYQDFFPNDKVIIADAHEYLLDHYKEYDFIWSSPPCPTHSTIRAGIGVSSGQVPATYPDMTLYQEIIFLIQFFKGVFCVENVIPYYQYLISPTIIICGHPIWSNFFIDNRDFDIRCHHVDIKTLQKRKGFNLSNYKNIDKRKILRNCVEPEIGKYILDQSLNIHDEKQKTLFD